jgi:hypothetical protein
MKTFYCVFSEHLPVGLGAVIVAADEQQAQVELRLSLMQWLEWDQDLNFVEVDPHNATQQSF